MLSHIEKRDIGTAKKQSGTSCPGKPRDQWVLLNLIKFLQF